MENIVMSIKGSLKTAFDILLQNLLTSFIFSLIHNLSLEIIFELRFVFYVQLQDEN